MKKILTIFATSLFLILFFQTISFSTPNPAPNTCYAGVYPVSNTVSRGIQGIFGLNFGARKIVESIIESQISNLIQKGNIKVSLKSYSAGDLIAGKIKNFHIVGKKIESNGIYLSKVEAESLCDFTWFDYKSKPALLKSPLFIKYSADVSKEDLKKIFESDTIKSALTGIKVRVGLIDFGEVDFVNIKPDIKNEKISMKISLVYRRMPFTFTFPINLETAIKVKDDKIFLTSLKFPSGAVNDEFRFITNSLELNNINIFDLKTLEKDGSEINIKKIKIVNDKIFLEGIFWLPQDTKL